MGNTDKIQSDDIVIFVPLIHVVGGSDSYNYFSISIRLGEEIAQVYQERSDFLNLLLNGCGDCPDSIAEYSPAEKNGAIDIGLTFDINLNKDGIVDEIEDLLKHLCRKVHIVRCTNVGPKIKALK